MQAPRGLQEVTHMVMNSDWGASVDRGSSAGGRSSTLSERSAAAVDLV